MTVKPNEKIQTLLDAHNGTLPAVSYLGGYSILYITPQGEVACSDCANEHPEWHIDYFTYWEGSPLYCDGCQKELPSVYGDPDDDKPDLNTDIDF